MSCCVSVLPPRRYGLAAGHVVPHRRRDANRIDADVVVEAPVLDREHRLDHVLRDVLQRNVPPLLPRPMTTSAVMSGGSSVSCSGRAFSPTISR